jgi:hypothetical protein
MMLHLDPQRKRTEAAAAPCPQRETLVRDFTAALRELVNLQNEQIHAVLTHDPEFARFDILVDLAMRAKREAKYALMRHLEEHRCEERSQDA